MVKINLATKDKDFIKTLKQPKKTFFRRWQGMLLLFLPIIAGGGYFIFFSGFIKVASTPSVAPVRASFTQKKDAQPPEKTVIQGEILPENKENKENLREETEETKLPPKEETETLKASTTKTEPVKAATEEPEKEISLGLSKKYGVRIGVCRLEANAGAIVNDARKKGYEAFVTVSKKKIEEKRIYVGEFETLRKVRKVRNTLSKNRLENYPEKLENGKLYKVYVGPFSRRKDIRKEKRLLKKLGFTTKSKLTKATRELNYIWVGDFSDKKDAYALREKIKRDFNGCLIDSFTKLVRK